MLHSRWNSAWMLILGAKVAIFALKGGKKLQNS